MCILCELIHLLTAGKEDRVSFSDGKSKFEINLGLDNCYQFLELIIIITVLCRVPEGGQSEQCCLNVSEMLSLPQVVVQVLHCSGGWSSAAGDTRGGTGSRSDGSRAGISVCTRRGRWSAKGNGLAGSRHFSNEASQELADPSLILLGYVPECVFTFFSLNICK